MCPSAFAESMNEVVVLDGRSLTVDQLVQIADGAKVDLDASMDDRIRRGRAVVDRYVRESIPAYGLTTGLGMRAGELLTADELTEFSYRIVRGRAQAIGDPLSGRAARAVMVARLNTMLDGAAGVSADVAPFMVEVLNRSLVPVLPEIGSIGSGDLVAMASMALAFIGEGWFASSGLPRHAAEALADAELRPLALLPKDGAVLCNNTAFSTGLAALATDATRTTLGTLQLAGALTIAAFQGNPSPFEAAVLRLRPQAGQVAMGDEIRSLLGSNGPEARRLQDPLSLRCMASVHGAASAALEDLESAVVVELNSAPDNPAVLVDEGRCVSTGNFHLSRLAQSLDTAARALAWCANDAVSRVHRLASSAMSGLPPLLATPSADRAGFGPMLKPIEALRAHVIHLATPVPIVPSHNADGYEDAVTFSALAAQKLDHLVRRVQLIAAFELIAASQAVDLRGSMTLSLPLRRVFDAVRAVSPFLDEDRPIANEVEAVATMIGSGRLRNQAYTSS
jgi:histidine ammonia-lyase